MSAETRPAPVTTEAPSGLLAHARCWADYTDGNSHGICGASTLGVDAPADAPKCAVCLERVGTWPRHTATCCDRHQP